MNEFKELLVSIARRWRSEHQIALSISMSTERREEVRAMGNVENFISWAKAEGFAFPWVDAVARSEFASPSEGEMHPMRFSRFAHAAMTA